STLGSAPVTLTATRIFGQSVFAGWSGACTGTGTTCDVVLDGTVDVSAQFSSTVSSDVMLTLALIEGAAGESRPSWKVTASDGSRTVECDMVTSGAGRGNHMSCANRWEQWSVITLTALSPLPTDTLSWGGDCTVGVVGPTGYQTCTL